MAGYFCKCYILFLMFYFTPKTAICQDFCETSQRGLISSQNTMFHKKKNIVSIDTLHLI